MFKKKKNHKNIKNGFLKLSYLLSKSNREKVYKENLENLEKESEKKLKKLNDKEKEAVISTAQKEFLQLFDVHVEKT